MDLATSENNVGARAVYESLDFSHHVAGPDNPVMYLYEREL